MSCPTLTRMASGLLRILFGPSGLFGLSNATLPAFAFLTTVGVSVPFPLLPRTGIQSSFTSLSVHSVVAFAELLPAQAPAYEASTVVGLFLLVSPFPSTGDISFLFPSFSSLLPGRVVIVVAATVLAFLLSLISSNIEWSLIALIGRCSVRHCLPPETFPWCRRCLARAPLHWGLSHISGDLVTSEDFFLGDSGTACSMCSVVFNGMLQFILFSIISLKVCHLVVL